MGIATNRERRFTYGDYLRWTGDERWEVDEGRPIDMTPAPSRKHQQIVLALARQIADFLDGHECEVYVAPFDVRLPLADEADEEVETVVQPDITVICDPNQLDERGCRGAPRWIIEVLSPASRARDEVRKLEIYSVHGVSEYWIIDPTAETLTKHALSEDPFEPGKAARARGQMPVEAVPGLEIDFEAVWATA